MTGLRKLAVVLAAVAGVAAAAMVYHSAAAADSGAPPMSHSLASHEQCLTCHGIQGALPAPASHATFDQGSCLSCHTSPASTAQAEICLSCHSQPGLSMTVASGESLSLYVDPQKYASSIHGGKLLCTDCHTSIASFPHPQSDIPSLREYSIAQYELCKRCHFDNYTKTLDSIHYQMLSGGDLRAPLCTDCHGAHYVTPPDQPRARISQTCSQCHQSVYEQYASSVHGKALIEDNNYDVPVCTDCHLAHTIADPRTASFRLSSVELCSNCHSNEKLMQKYGISTSVVKTYLQDFHGASVALTGEEGKDIWPQEAVCTDCHGVHDIQMVNNANSPVIKANLLATCQKCHPEATANFPGAWLSHYEPSIDKAPLVFFVRWFYRILIPFILLGLGAHILIDLWRVLTNR
ncbi:MAG: cytochrome c3 family protein [Chloroflexota bacterium]